MNPEHVEQTRVLERDITSLNNRFDRHLEIYAKNGKELANVKEEVREVKTNQSWLMKFFFIFMTPMIAGMVYVVIKIATV